MPIEGNEEFYYGRLNLEELPLNYTDAVLDVVSKFQTIHTTHEEPGKRIIFVRDDFPVVTPLAKVVFRGNYSVKAYKLTSRSGVVEFREEKTGRKTVIVGGSRIQFFGNKAEDIFKTAVETGVLHLPIGDREVEEVIETRIPEIPGVYIYFSGGHAVYDLDNKVLAYEIYEMGKEPKTAREEIIF